MDKMLRVVYERPDGVIQILTCLAFQIPEHIQLPSLEILKFKRMNDKGICFYQLQGDNYGS